MTAVMKSSKLKCDCLKLGASRYRKYLAVPKVIKKIFVNAVSIMVNQEAKDDRSKLMKAKLAADQLNKSVSHADYLVAPIKCNS